MRVPSPESTSVSLPLFELFFPSVASLERMVGNVTHDRQRSENIYAHIRFRHVQNAEQNTTSSPM